MVVDEKTLVKCAEAAFMSNGGWRLRGAWDFLDARGKAQWTHLAEEVLLAAGLEVRKEVLKS